MIPHATAAVLAKQILKNDIKIVTTLHGTDITLVGLEPSFEPLMKFSIESSDAVTAVSKFLRDETIGNYDVGKDIEVIPNFDRHGNIPAARFEKPSPAACAKWRKIAGAYVQFPGS